MSRSEIAFEEAVWAAVASRTGVVRLPCREAYQEKIQRYRSLGLPSEVVASVIADQLDSARARFRSGLSAFNLLVTVVEELGKAVDGELDRWALVDLMLASKLGMAEIYHELAGISEAADVDRLPTTQETAQMVEESRAQLEEFRAARRPE